MKTPASCRTGRFALVSLSLLAGPVLAQMPPPSRMPPPPASHAPERLQRLPALTPRSVAAQAAGKLEPESGRWNTFVTVNGPGFGKAEHVSVAWYPNDDDSQKSGGGGSATLRRRIGADGIEIEIPNGAGGGVGAVVRIYVHLPGAIKPVLAGRFTIADSAPLLRGPPVNRQIDGELELRASDLPQPVIVSADPQGTGELNVRFTQAAPAGIAIQTISAHAKAIGLNFPEVTGTRAGQDEQITLIGLNPGVDYEIWVRTQFANGRFALSKVSQVSVPPHPAAPAGTEAPANRYRLVITRTLAFDTSVDTAFGLDGQGDEIYFDWYTMTVNRATGAHSAPVAQASSVFGDTNGFPGRIRAGTAGPTGGIKEWDAFPTPVTLWEGVLDKGGDAVVIQMVIKEWDAPSGPGDCRVKALLDPKLPSGIATWYDVDFLRETYIFHNDLVSCLWRPVPNQIIGRHESPPRAGGVALPYIVLTRERADRVGVSDTHHPEFHIEFRDETKPAFADGLSQPYYRAFLTMQKLP